MAKRKYGNAKGEEQVYHLEDTDVFFEKDSKIIEKYYMPKERNVKSVGELIYDFFYFYTYEFNSN
jgi:hypothetical protein